MSMRPMPFAGACRIPCRPSERAQDFKAKIDNYLDLKFFQMTIGSSGAAPINVASLRKVGKGGKGKTQASRPQHSSS